MSTRVPPPGDGDEGELDAAEYRKQVHEADKWRRLFAFVLAFFGIAFLVTFLLLGFLKVIHLDASKAGFMTVNPEAAVLSVTLFATAMATFSLAARLMAPLSHIRAIAKARGEKNSSSSDETVNLLMKTFDLANKLLKMQKPDG